MKASGDQTNSRVFGDRRKAHPTHSTDYGKTLEVVSDKEVVVTLKNWNFQPDKATTINLLERHINPYLEWFWENKANF